MSRDNLREQVYAWIDKERQRQDDKFGTDAHYDNSNPKWLLILIEEAGELAEALLKANPEQARKELIEVAAVAVSWLETLASGWNRMESGWPAEKAGSL